MKMKKYYFLRKKYGFLRHFIKDIIFYKVPTHNNNNIYIFGIPTHANIGDQAIAIATRLFIEKNLPNKTIIEVPDYAVIKVAKYLSKFDYLEKLNVVFLGGGNMGDTWPQADIYKHEVYKKLPNATFIQFPQSTSFQSDGYNLPMVINDLKNVNSIVIARETSSLEFMKNNFLDTNILFSPDIVLSLNMQNTSFKRKYVTTFFRKDIEKKSNELMSQTDEYLVENIGKLNRSDTVITDFKGPLTQKNREQLFLKKIQEFQKSKLIVTDRLHGMIFATITGTPAIVFDNSNHKIKFTYYDWLKDVPYIYFVEDDVSFSDIEEKIRHFSSIESEYAVPDLNIEYEEVIQLLKFIS